MICNLCLQYFVDSNSTPAPLLPPSVSPIIMDGYFLATIWDTLLVADAALAGKIPRLMPGSGSGGSGLLVREHKLLLGSGEN